MKVKIVSHSDPALIGTTCDVVYYDFCERTREVIFKAYDGRVLELRSSEVRVIVEDALELEELERYVFKKVFESCLSGKKNK
jgi:hypothetical protein